MKVLAICASPRKGGNSDVLCDQFLKGAAENGNEVKKIYYIITAADPEHSAADETIAGLRGYLRCLPGAKEKGIIYGTGTWDKGDVYRHPSFEKAYALGKMIGGILNGND